MDIKNLTLPTPPSPLKLLNPALLFIVVVLALVSGFWLSRLLPGNSAAIKSQNGQLVNLIDPESIKSTDDIKVGQTYGDVGKDFNDSATGTIEKGDINGVGTHILSRPGGLSQRVSLTSSVLDLDLFENRQVEIKGQTNASNKTGWLLDVGIVKVLQ